MTNPCGTCGASSPPGAKFWMSRTCPGCGAPAEGYRFCPECGTALEAGTAPARPEPPPATAPVSERRTTTVLFGDLAGFTPLSESRDPRRFASC